MNAFTIGYIKGSARCTTLLLILALCFEDTIDIQQEPLDGQTVAALPGAPPIRAGFSFSQSLEGSTDQPANSNHKP